MRENAIRSLHDESGHFCHTKTLNRVKYRYFWPGMSTAGEGLVHEMREVSKETRCSAEFLEPHFDLLSRLGGITSVKRWEQVCPSGD